MKKKILSMLLCMVFICTLSLPVYADSDSSSSDGYSAIISDIPTTCPTCGEKLHAFWWSTSGAEVELQISEAGKISIPAGSGSLAHINLRCSNCGYEKKETRVFGLDIGTEKPGKWEVKQAPSGIGRKDLPGYSDSNVPDVSQSGQLHLFAPVTGWFASSASTSNYPLSTNTDVRSYKTADISGERFSSSSSSVSPIIVCSFTAPVNGTYTVKAGSRVGYYSYLYGNDWKTYYGDIEKDYSFGCAAGKTYFLEIYVGGFCRATFVGGGTGVDIYVTPLSSTLKSQTNITINNNTWNGNIYVDNSTNLTYIYPQYTTINENNETVTNISTNPIIYNSETKQYYTYDSVTQNYYYIIYNENPATPTPSPSPTPDPDNPDVTPTPTPGGNTSGGSTSTPEAGDKDNSGGSSWNPFKWLLDLLKDIVETILKGLWKLLTSIFGFILWLLSLLFKLFPWMPNSGILALCAGVVVVTVIRIIKFITGR